LAHPSIKEFISHCGWNSILESVWFGVPLATWPMYAEQQFNAFEVVVELGLAVEIKMDYRREFLIGNETILGAKEIERGIKSGMEHDGHKLKRLKELSEKSRKAMMEGGSSSSSLSRLIKDMIIAGDNVHVPRNN
jgi:histidinol phosphatase-like PHP family hydrolase